MASLYILMILLSFIFLINLVEGRFEFTNVKCLSLDEDFTKFEYCYLKSVNRTYKYMSLKANMFQIPITNVKTNIAIMKRLNGYKPFLYNITVDSCKILKNRNGGNPVAKYLYGLFLPFMNVEYCPIDHDVIVDKLSIGFLNTQVTDVLPLPEGNYAFYSNWFVANKTRADVRVYFTVS